MAGVAQWSTLHEMVAAQAERFGERTAILAPSREPLSFLDLHEQVLETQARLWEIGVGRGDVVASVLPTGPEAATALLCVSSCASFAPLNPNLRSSEYEGLFEELKPKIVLAAPGRALAARKAATAAGIVVVEVAAQGKAGAFALEGVRCPDRSPAAGQLTRDLDFAYILTTSGSTGRPKLVPATHGSACQTLGDFYALTSSDRCLNFSAPFHALGLLGGLVSPLSNGGSTVLTAGFQPERFFEWLDLFQPTWFSGVPTVLQDILAQAGQHADTLQRASIRFIRSAGAPLADSIADGLEAAFRTRVVQVYGLSEASGVTGERLDDPRGRRSCGRPAGCEVAVMDERGRVLPAGEPGEIVLRGATVFQGYLGNTQATQQAFRDGWFLTRDIGYLDADGCLHLTGRASEFINRGAEKISPLEIDQVLMTHPAVAKAVAFSVPHDKLGEDVAAAVVLREGASATEAQLIEFAAGHLAAHKLPGRVYFLDQLPVGATGKVQRSKMREHVAVLAGDREAAQIACVKPRDDRERRIAGILARVLRLDRVGIHDDFFQLGGDSLAATECALLLEEEFGIESLSPGVFRWAPTVAHLAEILADPARLEQPYGVIPLQVEGEGMPLYLIEPGDEGPRIAQHLGANRPFYGIPIPPSEDPSQPRSIEQMAEECVRALRRFQREGPYALAGWCAHGVIALEMAQQLEGQGCEVSFVALLDARNFFLPPLSAPHLAWVKLWRRIRKLCFRTRHWPRSVWKQVRAKVTAQPEAPLLETTHALRRYRPKPWAGRMVHIWCKVWPHGLYFDARFGWNHLAPAGFVFHEVPGDHLTFIQEPNVAQVAHILAGELDRAQISRRDLGVVASLYALTGTAARSGS